MHHTMTAAAPARTVTGRRPAVAVKSDVRTGHDIAYVTRGHASGCAGAMAYYYTRTGDPPGTWEGRGTAALGVSGTVQAEIAERLYQHGVGPGGERIIRHAAPKAGEDQAVAEAVAIARYREEHPFASASEINAERTRIRATSPGISRPYYDVTSSASKSVSVLHASLRVAAGQARGADDHVTAAALDGEAQAIEDALLDAVREGLELLEAMACYVRTGHHSKDTGEWRDGKGLVATSWLHTISRDGDPQLHVHLAVLNAVQRADGADEKWRADGQHFYQLRHVYGVTVDRAFEQRLLDMGYAMVGRPDGNGAEVGGVSQQVMDRFSSRAQAIDSRLQKWVDQYTAKHGKPPSRRTIYLMGQEIAKDTRRPKVEAKRMAGGRDAGHPVSDEERLKAWEDQTTADELQVLSAVHAEAKAYAAHSTLHRELTHADKARAARIAVAEAQRQRSVWGISDLCLEIHRALPVGATPADITEVAMLAISGTAGEEIVQVSPAPDLMDISSLGVRQSDGQSIFRKPNTMRWAALSHLNLEEQVISQARRPIRPLVTEQQVRAELDRHDQQLDEEQRQAVISLLTADRAMVLLTAPAGAGKTRTIAAAAAVWHTLTGGRLIGLTLSENAARVMKAEGLPEAYNIARFLGKCRDSDRLRHPVHIGPADKLVIDEASQVGTADLALIQQAAGPAGVLSAGDPAQLGPVEAGGWFSWFASKIGTAELHEVRRFASPWEADASLQLRRGDKTALAAYDTHGRIRAGDREAMHDKAAMGFLADFLEGKDSVLVAGSNAEAADLARLHGPGKHADRGLPASADGIRSAQQVGTVWVGDLLEHGAGELLDLGWQGHVAVGGGVGLAVVGEPVEHGDQGQPGGLAGLAGVDQRPAVPADRVAVSAGLVDDGEIGRGDGGLLGGVGGDGPGGREDVVPGLVADRGERQQQALVVGLLDVADGERGAVHLGGHPGIALVSFPDRPAGRLAGADLGCPGRVDAGQVVGEDVGGAAAVGTVHDGDPRVREGQARVKRGDGGVVPVGDLPEVDLGEHRAGQVQPGACREGQVVGDAFAAQVDRDLGDRSAFGGGQFTGIHGHVGGAEVDLLRADRGDARAAADHGIGDGHAWVQLLVSGEGCGEERRVERRPGPGQGWLWAAGADAASG
jgi:conjugative relaxase-like TrwC/TraI family protein